MSIVQALGPVPLLSAGAASPLDHIWNNPPVWIAVAFAFAIAVAGLYTTVIKPLGSALQPVLRLVSRLFQKPDADEAHRIRLRRLFAGHVVRQLDHLAGKEDWHDERFAELEAEVETEGRERVVPWMRRLSPTRTVTLRREKSLSIALTRSEEPLVILEGEPGAGKSVALRHLAQQLACRAREVRHAKTATFLIPLYVNLKDFKPAHRPADAPAVRQFILESLNRINDRDVDTFLEEEFDRGLLEGTWLLLLDSFDEIPDVLSSTESDSAVEEYALAIRDFLSGMKQCRAVIASREFRGPKAMFRVPHFRVVSLSARQQRDLVQRSGLKPTGQGALQLGLASADAELRQLAKNPMYLSLVCEYVRRNGEFPPNSYTAYDSYLAQRLARDEARIQQSYTVDAALVKRVAERAAYCMAAVTGLGLSPTRRALRAEIAASAACFDEDVEKALDALEYTKLGRSQDDLAEGAERRFTFAHRRFQEYFATQVVLREPGLVTASDLLTNGRWRETAVTILQTQPADVVVPLLGEAGRILAPVVADVDQMAVGPLFSWPPGCLHLLQLLHAGLGRAPDGIPSALRAGVGKLLRTAWEKGRRHNRRMAVSLALIADRETTIWLLERAFASGSVLLGGEAYLCVSRLADPPQGLYRGVRRALLDMAASGQLGEERLALKAQMSRLPEPTPLLRILRMLSAARYLDVAMAVLLMAIAALIGLSAFYLIAPIAIFGLLALRPMFAYPRMGSGNTSETWLDGAPGIVYAALASRGMVLVICTIALLQSLTQIRRGEDALAALGICLGICGIYFSVWCFAVPYACINGSPVSVPGWFYAPFKFMAQGARIVRSPENRRAKIILLVVSSCAVGVTLQFHNDIYRIFMSKISGYVMLSLLVIAVIVGSGVLAYHGWKCSRDSKVIREMEGAKEVRTAMMLEIIGRMQTRYGCDKVLGVACSWNLVEYPELMRAVADLAFAIERVQMDWEWLGSPVHGLRADVLKWLVAYRERERDTLFSVSDWVLDKVARAVAEADVAHQGELASQPAEALS
jgi:hypothetical protein